MRKQPASIALTTVILTSAIMLSAGITLLITSVDLSRSREGHGAQIAASVQLNSCNEEALRRISQDSSFTGTIVINELSEELCRVEVSNDPGESTIKVLQLTGTYRGYTVEETRRYDSEDDLNRVG